MDATIRDVKRAIEYNLDNNIRRSILLLGAPGIGKSDIIKEIADKRGIKFIDLRLLLYSETDLKGIPFPDEETGSTRWLPNKILPDASRDGEHGILLIDELTSAPKRVQAAAYQLIQDYKLGEYSVPEGWFIVAAGNREDDDGVFVQMPSPLANRFEIFNVKPDLEIWKTDFAYPHNVNTDVIAYLSFKPTALHTQEPGQNSMSFCSPRSWVAVSDILNAGGDIRDTLIQLKICGNIGDIEVSSFKAFLESKESIIKADLVLNGTIKEPPKEKSILCLTITSLTSKLSYLKDISSLSPDDIMKLTNVATFYTKMQAEMFALGLKDLVGINSPLIKTFLKTEFDSEDILDFLVENDYLFSI